MSRNSEELISWIVIHAIAVDIQGPYPTGDNILVTTDYHSRYLIAAQMKLITAMKQTFTTFGYPKTTVTDNGSQFKSFNFKIYLQKRGTK